MSEIGEVAIFSEEKVSTPLKKSFLCVYIRNSVHNRSKANVSVGELLILPKFEAIALNAKVSVSESMF